MHYSRFSKLALRAVTTISLLGGVMVLGACGGDGVGNDGALVGGSCAATADCDERCLQGKDYPEGTCTASCSTDAECPEGTNCIDKEGGVCLLTCARPSDCRGGYSCKGERNKGTNGDSLVCISD